MAAWCASCGAAIQGGKAFCGACGAAQVPSTLGVAAPGAAPVTPPPAPMPPPPPPGSWPATAPPGPASGYGGAPAPAAARPPVPGRNVAAAVIALVGVVLVLGGTFLPIVEIDVSGFSESANGWGADFNDGPIHLVVCVVPVVMGVLALLGRARVVVKVLLIVSALIGFFWVAVRFADVSGSLEEGTTGAFVAEVTDPGIGLFVITVGWVLVLVAGLVATAARPPKVLGPPRVYPPVPRPHGRSRPA